MLIKYTKKLIFAILIIYSLDLLLKSLNIFVPINIFTIISVATLGFPGLITLALSFFFLL